MNFIDLELFYLFNQTRNPLLDLIMPIFSSKVGFLPFILVFILSMGTFIGRMPKKIMVLVAVLFLGGYGLSDFTCAKLVKPIFDRERPFVSLKNLYYYSPEGKFVFLEEPISRETQSLPSCHATNSAFLTTYLFLLLRKTLILTLPTTLLIGSSRVYLGHHYPFDVLAGWLYGTFLGILLWQVLKCLNQRIATKNR